MIDLFGNFFSGAIIDNDLFFCYLSKLTIIQINYISRIRNKCCNIGCKIVFTNTDADKKRTVFSDRNDFFRLVSTDYAKRIGTLQS